MEKLDFICSCAIDSVKAGGSVLIPVNRVGVILQLLEQIVVFLESSSLKVCNNFFFYYYSICFHMHRCIFSCNVLFIWIERQIEWMDRPPW